jgi:hypothetical protein
MSACSVPHVSIHYQQHLNAYQQHRKDGDFDDYDLLENSYETDANVPSSRQMNDSKSIMSFTSAASGTQQFRQALIRSHSTSTTNVHQVTRKHGHLFEIETNFERTQRYKLQLEKWYSSFDNLLDFLERLYAAIIWRDRKVSSIFFMICCAVLFVVLLFPIRLLLVLAGKFLQRY